MSPHKQLYVSGEEYIELRANFNRLNENERQVWSDNNGTQTIADNPFKLVLYIPI
jgi:hypothetical protein